ncbi:MAG: beta-lactamase family protein [Cyclobacteriaceae bacterium]|nr:beta-lactamase family protein [Cyclobacteriaceae bacterium]
MILLFGCAEKKEPINTSADAIMSALQPTLQIEGDDVPTYTIEERLRMLNIPGISIAVVVDGELAWARGYGIADSAANKPVTPETLFLAGSISKPVAALAALNMVEEGRLSLDENVNTGLVSWKLPDNEFTIDEKVTLRRILNHTAGLTVWGFPGYDKGDTIPSMIDVLDGKGNTDSVRVYKKPGESWMYSGGGYTIMQLLMTDVERKPFPTIMDERVLTPLGMDKSTYENPLPAVYHTLAATGYRANGREVEGKWPIYPEMAAAGLWTTPSQLIRYVQGIQNIYLKNEKGIISKALTLEMLTPGMNNHGLGPGIGKDELWWGHGGADEGFRAQMVAWKNQPNAIVVMVNSDNGTIINEVLIAIAKTYGWPGFGPTIKKVIPLDPSIGQAIEGDWEIDRVGPARLSFEDGHLIITGSFLDKPVVLLAENDSTFFDRTDGQQITFSKTEGKINRLRVGQLSGKKTIRFQE